MYMYMYISICKITNENFCIFQDENFYPQIAHFTFKVNCGLPSAVCPSSWKVELYSKNSKDSLNVSPSLLTDTLNVLTNTGPIFKEMRDVNFLLLGTGQETDISVCTSPLMRSSPADVVPPSNKTYRHNER